MTSNSDPITPVVILHLDCTTGLQAARTFGQRGVPVIGISENLDHYCCRSKHLARVIRSGYQRPELTNALLQLATEIEGKAVLWPCSDETVMAVSHDREVLAEHYHLQLPAHETVLDVMEKSRFYQRAMETGLPIPRTLFINTPQDLDTACETLDFPCVLKPSARTLAWRAATGVKAYKIEEAAELRRIVTRVGPCDTALIAQDWIEGGDGELFSCYAYISSDLALLAATTCRKIRQWPPDTGSGCSNRICEAPEIVEVTRRICQQMNCWGLMFVQFKQDPRDGRYLIIEPHVGRPGVGMFVSEAAGVEMHYTAYCDLLGLDLPPVRKPLRDDAVWVHLYNDIRAAYVLRCRGELTLRSWLRSLRGRRRTAVFSWSDPLPFLLELATALRRVKRRWRGQINRSLATEN